ncbi:C2orf42 family protein [Megaselia abdita]
MSIELQPRKTFRGVRKCKSCGILRANRSKTCKNTQCFEHEGNQSGSLVSRNKLDSVKLISYVDSMLYSVQSKEKESKRDFVQLTEITLISDENNSIVSQNAICFMENCNHIPREETVSCKHVQSANDSRKTAVEIPITKKVLFELNIPQEKKTRLWKFYNEQKSLIPPVQKVNSSIFTVACPEVSLQFPAKRLHVKLKETVSCACKRLKIVMSADESFVFRDEICEHILLVLASVLSSEVLRKDYKSFLSEVESIWRPVPEDKMIIQQHEITEILNNLCEMSSQPIMPHETSETSEFSKWMNFVIESINLTLDFKTENMNIIRHSFNIHVDTFETLAKRFCKGNKRMLPSKKYTEGYAWRLLTPHIVKKVFSTEEVFLVWSFLFFFFFMFKFTDFYSFREKVSQRGKWFRLVGRVSRAGKFR